MDNMQKQNVRQVIKRLIADDGWKGFYRGLGPRFFSMSAWGTTMIVAYEYLSKKILLSLQTISYFAPFYVFCFLLFSCYFILEYAYSLN